MSMIISERAIVELRNMGVGGESFLRISVIPGGCSGHTYSAAADDALQPGDRVVHQAGDFRVVADPRSAVHLDGLDIDYSEDLVQSGFRFKNPNTAKACGCGASFQL
jgi:iron-sulfur cluster assembly protein